MSLQWRHNERDGVSNHQPHDGLFNRLFRRKSKKTSRLRVTGLCEGNSPVTGEFPAQRDSNAENVSIWWRLDEIYYFENVYICFRSALWYQHHQLPWQGCSNVDLLFVPGRHSKNQHIYICIYIYICIHIGINGAAFFKNYVWLQHVTAILSIHLTAGHCIMSLRVYKL